MKPKATELPPRPAFKRRMAGDQGGDPFPPEWLEIPPAFRRAKPSPPIDL
jgi:hypothetical protein